MWGNNKIAVLGDIMLDISVYGSTSKLANEAPIPVLSKQYKTLQLGGCGNVLSNLHSLGCKNVFILIY
jgi:D-beta-D-heptose 7-phosphate kinase/D-beta-D-heptose 1-phosphate adenosyltransferase